MELIKTQSLSLQQKLDIIELWNEEYPKALSLSGLEAFEEYLQNLEDKHHLILTDETGSVKGWLIYFIRDHERCFAMLLHASLQGKGWGSRLLNFAKAHNSSLIGWVIDHETETKQNGENYKSPIAFYRKNGFEILSDVQWKKQNINGIKVKWQAQTASKSI